MRKWKLLVGVLISLLCLVLAFAGVEWRRAGEALQRGDWRHLLPAGVAVLGYLLARASRWRILLGSEVGLVDAFSIINIGYLISNVLPFRLGDPARAVAVSLDGRVKVSTALSTIVVERVLDMLTVVLLLTVTVPFVEEAGWTRRAGLLGGGVGLIAIATLVWLAVRPEWSRRAFRWVLGRLPSVEEDRWVEGFDGLLEGLEALRSARQVAGLIAWSVVIWVLTAGHYLAILGAFIEQPTVVEASFLTAATGLGMALPSAPGAMGVFHSVARYALQLPFGVAAETAVVVAFAAHTFQYVIMCLLGLIGLLQQNITFAQLRADATATVAKE